MWIDLPHFELSFESTQPLQVEREEELYRIGSHPEDPEFFATVTKLDFGRGRKLSEWVDEKLLMLRSTWPRELPGGPRVLASRAISDGWLAVLESVSTDNGQPEFIVCSQRALGGASYELTGLCWTAEAARRVAATLYSVRVRLLR